ncbi:(d)CMP kinase [Nitrospira sp. Kam-Ns4a]
MDSRRATNPNPPRREPASARRLLVTIDGPAGAGKSTVARRLARRLGYFYLDTGSLYRALAWKATATGVSPADSQAVTRMLSETSLTIEGPPDSPRVLMDGRDVTQEIRTPEVSRAASVIAAIPAVREWLIPVQRRLGAAGGIVAEGRDLGTRIFPTADVKFFLDARLEVRAERRHQELVRAGHVSGLEEARADLDARDSRDRSREVAPLRPAPDAHVIDTSMLEVDDVIERMMAEIATKL